MACDFYSNNDFETRCHELDAKRDESKARPPVAFSYNVVGDELT